MELVFKLVIVVEEPCLLCTVLTYAGNHGLYEEATLTISVEISSGIHSSTDEQIREILLHTQWNYIQL